mgnify:CR=1 FL=1
MGFPKEKGELIALAREWHKWISDPKALDSLSQELGDVDLGVGYVNFGVCIIFHVPLYVITQLSKAIGFWWLASICCRLRIITDRWSFEPRQCGYNRAHTILGLYNLKRNDVDAAISALKESWQVYPCPHNTSFGLLLSLSKALENIPKAQGVVDEYKEICREFKGVVA